MAIGADTSQGRPGDALEFTAAAGGGAFVIGPNPVAKLEGMFSYTTDTPDFWRREGEDYPTHGARFTGKPAYFKHVLAASRGLMEKLSLEAKDFDWVVLHMPNGKFPIAASKILGFPGEKLADSLVVKRMGNCYSGSSPLGLCALLDIAKPGQRILMTSYGSGAGSDSFSWAVTDRINEVRDKAKKTDDYLNKKKNIDYGTYVRLRRKLKW
jgi:hydroxymethylglutaryl-CoA synthase